LRARASIKNSGAINDTREIPNQLDPKSMIIDLMRI